jgi:hypothetical protein
MSRRGQLVSGHVAALVLAATLLFWALGAHNRLVAQRNAIAQAWARVQEALRQRATVAQPLVAALREPLAAEHGALDGLLLRPRSRRARRRADMSARPVLPAQRPGLGGGRSGAGRRRHPRDGLAGAAPGTALAAPNRGRPGGRLARRRPGCPLRASCSTRKRGLQRRAWRWCPPAGWRGSSGFSRPAVFRATVGCLDLAGASGARRSLGGNVHVAVDFHRDLHAHRAAQRGGAFAADAVVDLRGVAPPRQHAGAVQRGQVLAHVGLGGVDLGQQLRDVLLLPAQALMIFSRMGVASSRKSSAAESNT